MSQRNPSYSNPTPCNHLADYKLRYGLNGYKSIQNLLKTAPNGRASIQNPDSKLPRCGSCDGYKGRLYICLICASISCSNHTLVHNRSDNGHDLAVDIERAELFCYACSDQVYDPDFDRTVMSKHIVAAVPEKSQSQSQSAESIGERSSKRRRLGSVDLLDLKNLKPLISVKDQRSKSCYPLGLRGLNNLGNTCFMNSVLQVFLHTPPLSNYFLNDQHNRETCSKRPIGQLCLPCDIDCIFSAVFSGDHMPYSPAQFLYSWWQHSANLACYEQQDAHEFFISVLDRIHERERKSRSQDKENGDCKCIAHKAFSGQLRSDVTCMTCGFTSTTYDPCVDISLDLDTQDFSSRNIAGKSVKPADFSSKSTLSGCLDLFTRPEKLGSDQKLFCQNCQEKRNSVKQMSIRRLPLVLCLHIKRFEHSFVRRTSRKIDRYLQFPFSLDMIPYLSSSIIRNRYGNRIFASEGDELDASTKFEIFAVVSHSGTLESGHYVTYLRLRNRWYKCDDAWITEVDEEMVRNSQCYMMFYLQKIANHKANEDLSCLPISPRNNAFQQIAGCC